MDRGQTRERSHVLIADIRLLADDAESGARHIADDDVRLLRKRFIADTAIGQADLHALDPQPLRTGLHEPQLVLLHIAGENVSFPFHAHRHGEGLPAGGGAGVDDKAPRLRRGSQSRQLRRGILHREPALAPRAQTFQIAGAGNGEAVREPRVRLHGYALILQRGAKLLRGRFERVGLNGGRNRLIVRAEKGFRLLRAEQADHALDERTRVARLYGERFELVRKGKRLSPSAVHIAQHCVHQSRRAG